MHRQPRVEFARATRGADCGPLSASVSASAPEDGQLIDQARVRPSTGRLGASFFRGPVQLGEGSGSAAPAVGGDAGTDAIAGGLADMSERDRRMRSPLMCGWRRCRGLLWAGRQVSQPAGQECAGLVDAVGPVQAPGGHVGVQCVDQCLAGPAIQVQVAGLQGAAELADDVAAGAGMQADGLGGEPSGDALGVQIPRGRIGAGPAPCASRIRFRGAARLAG